MTDNIEKAVLQEMLERRKRELVSCERMMELLKPEWDKFEGRTGHDVYVARDYADHFSAARTHRKEIAALEAAIAAIQLSSQEPVEQRCPSCGVTFAQIWSVDDYLARAHAQIAGGQSSENTELNATLYAGLAVCTELERITHERTKNQI